jgi:hypothetical protein
LPAGLIAGDFGGAARIVVALIPRDNPAYHVDRQR